jgi:hypothetical protein
MRAATKQMTTVTSQAMRESGTGRLFSPTVHEPCLDPAAVSSGAALTPALALDYLRELSADIRTGVVLGSDGALLAGPEALAEPARDLFAGAGETRELQVVTRDGDVFAARSDRHRIAVVTGRFALPSLIRYDLKLVLADLEGAERPEAP